MSSMVVTNVRYYCSGSLKNSIFVRGKFGSYSKNGSYFSLALKTRKKYNAPFKKYTKPTKPQNNVCAEEMFRNVQDFSFAKNFNCPNRIFTARWVRSSVFNSFNVPFLLVCW